MKYNQMIRNKSSLAVFTVTVLASAIAQAAPVQPDAGQTMREIQKQPQLTVPKVVTPLRLEGELVPKGFENKDVLITVKSIRIEGTTIFSVSELDPLVADLIGPQHSLAQINAGVARITAYYRTRGYVVSRAYLPEQDIRNGVVVIRVLEGVLDKQQVKNLSLLSDDLANDYLQGIKSGSVLRAQLVDRALLLLGDTPGVGGARAGLQPGSSVGTTDLLVEIDPSKPYTANLDVDNYGNYYMGEYRIGGALALNSPLNIGDQFSVRGITSGSNMSYARVSYQFPVGHDGFRLGLAYADTRYSLGKTYAGVGKHGLATSSSAFATYPFIRSQSTNLSGTLTWETKKLVDQTDLTSTLVNKQVRLFNLGLSGNHQDNLFGMGVTSLDASLVSGRLDMDAVSLQTDIATAKTNGAYSKALYNLNRLQRVTSQDTLSFNLSGQQASKNLDSSELFSLGGANGVRAYPQGEGIGDQGWLTNFEIRHTLLNQLQGLAFYDAGTVTINRNPFAAGINTRHIAGVGFGLNAQYGWLQLKTSVAWRTSGGQPQSLPASVSGNPRLWAQFSGVF
jgi:hemolysin activation/secretion protein